jgi:hypothetical protein
VVGIGRPTIGADRAIESHDALGTSSGSRDNGRTQSSGPELYWIVVMRLNVIDGAGCNDFAFAQAHCAQRHFLHLTVRSTMPLRFVVQPSHR